MLLLVPAGRAQQPLFFINEQTTVRRVSFTFTDTQSFEEDQLKVLLATRGPSGSERLFGKLRKVPLLGLIIPRPQPHPLEPVEVQKDVVRLRSFYRTNGFLFTEVDYPASQLDTASNTIHVIYTITEGPPLLVRNVSVVAEDSAGHTVAFPAPLQAEWSRIEADRTVLQRGARFSSVDYAILKGQVLDWARNRGYPHARLLADSTLNLDSLYIDLRLALAPGPRAHVASVMVQGNSSVGDDVVRREVPPQRGKLFVQKDLVQGQRELFGLGLFRSVVADVPPQPVDSTVTVRYTVREARPRLVTAETGYSSDGGLLLSARWRHRNFLGDARTFDVQAIWSTGAGTTGEAPTRQELSVTVRQPYLFNRRLSGGGGPYIRRTNDPQVGVVNRALGVQADVLYEILPFRTASVRFVAERERIADRTQPLDDFSRRRLSLSASARLGRLNDYLNPRRGLDVRPNVELGLAGVTLPNTRVTTSLLYTRPQVETVYYHELSSRVDAAFRIYGGYLLPIGRARATVGGVRQDLTRELLSDFFFRDLRYRAGGSSDVRGWTLGRLGAQALELVEDPRDPSGARDTEGQTFRAFPTSAARYRAAGGRTKVAFNAELRMPFPGLGEKWRSAVFVDAGLLDARDIEGAGLSTFDFRGPSRVVLREIGYDPTLRIGTGVGLRYQTPVGYLRVDVAAKVNPTDADLYTPDELLERRYD
ncbi:MAG TPA: BamA/TamA family outer membrane protein, partial [Rhodothermales bacterium]|nr:BamA/TamA family outer membrane protein [Rhodothermales bacterium]